MGDEIIYTTNFQEGLRDLYTPYLIRGGKSVLAFSPFAETWNEFGAQKGETVYRNVSREPKGDVERLPETSDIDGSVFGQYRISATLYEHGETFGLTVKLRTLTYMNVVGERAMVAGRSLARTKEQLALRTMYNHPEAAFAGDATSFATLAAGDTLSTAELRPMIQELEDLDSVAHPDGYWTAFCHPRVKYTIMAEDDWRNTKIYQDKMDLYRNEIGLWHDVRFIQSTILRLPNAGAPTVETTLAANVTKGARTFVVASATGLAAGQEVSIGAPHIVDPSDGDYDAHTEAVRIKSINTVTVTIADESHFQYDHTTGDAVIEAPDVFPVIVAGPGAFAKCTALPEHLVFAPPTDKLQRFDYLGWYGIFDYTLTRKWQARVKFVLGA